MYLIHMLDQNQSHGLFLKLASLVLKRLKQKVTKKIHITLSIPDH